MRGIDNFHPFEEAKPQMNEAVIESLIREGRYYHSHNQQVTKSDADIEIISLETTLRPTQIEQHTGQQEVLVMPIQVINHSQQFFSASISHEWHGGEWPLTDLHVFIWYDGFKDHPGQQKLRPAYLLGETGSSAKPTVLNPDDSLHLNLRVDWPGTGSVCGGTLMPRDKSAIYELWIILFFKTGNAIHYTVSRKLQIEVVAP